MLTKNYDLADHLVNGVIGTVVDYEIPPNAPLSGKIYLKFDNDLIGKSKKQNSPRHLTHAVGVESITVKFILASNCSVPVERRMYPAVLAYGLTAHKSQGSTYQFMVADFTKHKQFPTPQGLALLFECFWFFCFGSCANYSCHFNCRFWKGRSVVVGRSPEGAYPEGA